MDSLNLSNYPNYLQSYEDLKDHFETYLGELLPKQKGNRFADFCLRLIILAVKNINTKFDDIELNPKGSYDGGIDLQGKGIQNSVPLLFGQIKYSINTVEDLDGIISKFDDFQKRNLNKNYNGQLKLNLGIDDESPDIAKNQYLIVTLSRIKRKILPKYEQSNFSSKKFYEYLKSVNNIDVIDGDDILYYIKEIYRRSYIEPEEINLHLEVEPISKGNVYISVISAKEIKACYDKYGDSLFLENIRDFFGFAQDRKQRVHSTAVNKAIAHTIEQHPTSMLARNNGITFRAESVKQVDKKLLKLTKASIVNGCQTTTCMALNPHEDACILVKVVETEDSWDVAKAANFQNEVKQIDLELAKYIRPQSVKAAASRTGGIEITSTEINSIQNVVETIYQNRVAFQEIQSIFTGLFSQQPNNVFNLTISALNNDLLEEFYQYNNRDEIYGLLFEIYKESDLAAKHVKEICNDESYSDIFRKFWLPTRYNYRSYLTILAACGTIRNNIYGSKDRKNRKESILNFQELVIFLNEILSIIQADKHLPSSDRKFVIHYEGAFFAVAALLLQSDKSKDRIKQLSYDSLRDASFDNLYRQMNMDADRYLSRINK
ncbi:MAG: AIPR family protein [Nodularia sp. CChRGM 3473]